MFQFSGFASLRMIYLQYTGLPHSDICGSTCMCQSPQLFAAYHVLHRLWEPRHSPYALIKLMLLPNDLYSYIFLYLIRYSQCILSYSLCLFQYVNERFIIINYIQLITKSWRISESNRWPPACKAGALASWANPPCLSDQLTVIS